MVMTKRKKWIIAAAMLIFAMLLLRFIPIQHRYGVLQNRLTATCEYQNFSEKRDYRILFNQLDNYRAEVNQLTGLPKNEKNLNCGDLVQLRLYVW